MYVVCLENGDLLLIDGFTINFKDNQNNTYRLDSEQNKFLIANVVMVIKKI